MALNALEKMRTKTVNLNRCSIVASPKTSIIIYTIGREQYF